MTFSEQIVNALIKPASYMEMVKLKKGRSKLFVLVMCLVLGIVTFAVPTGALIASFGGFDNLFDTQFSTLEFHDGKLSMDNKFSMKIDDVTILVDTSNPTVVDESLRKDGLYVTVGSERIALVYTLAGESYEYQGFALKELLLDGFNGASLKKMVPFIYGYLVLMFIFICVGFFIRYAFFSLVLGWWINRFNKEKGLGLSFGQVFMICFYGQSLGMIISNFNAALGLLPQMLVSLVCVFISIRQIAMAVGLAANRED